MQELVERLAQILNRMGLTLVTAESCTGGTLAAAITDAPGASSMFERGYVTYSNESKQEALGVPAEIIEKHGAVSAETACAMARGALAHSHAHVAVSITGIAGPDGGSEQKPVGRVYIAWGNGDKPPECAQHDFKGDRAAIRKQSAEAALQHLIDYIETLSVAP